MSGERKILNVSLDETREKLKDRENEIRIKDASYKRYVNILVFRHDHYVRKLFRKTNIFYPLIHTRNYAYQGVGKFSFLENFVYVLNG